jgi:hypothetical protein
MEEILVQDLVLREPSHRSYKNSIPINLAHVESILPYPINRSSFTLDGP